MTPPVWSDRIISCTRVHHLECGNICTTVWWGSLVILPGFFCFVFSKLKYLMLFQSSYPKNSALIKTDGKDGENYVRKTSVKHEVGRLGRCCHMMSVKHLVMVRSSSDCRFKNIEGRWQIPGIHSPVPLQDMKTGFLSHWSADKLLTFLRHLSVGDAAHTWIWSPPLRNDALCVSMRKGR